MTTRPSPLWRSLVILLVLHGVLLVALLAALRWFPHGVLIGALGAALGLTYLVWALAMGAVLQRVLRSRGYERVSYTQATALWVCFMDYALWIPPRDEASAVPDFSDDFAGLFHLAARARNR